VPVLFIEVDRLLAQLVSWLWSMVSLPPGAAGDKRWVNCLWELWTRAAMAPPLLPHASEVAKDSLADRDG